MIFFPKQALYSTSLFVISLVCAFVGTSCSSGVKEENPQVLSIPKPAIQASEKLVLSEKPEDKALCESLDKIIADRDAPNEKWGMMFVSLSDGRVLCARDARGLYLPASVQKLVTSAAALEKLGPGYRFRTSVFAKREIENGILDSDLVLYGRGAPDFDKTSLTGLVRDLKKKGLKTVKGDIVGDSSYFKADALGDGWTWNEAQWYYGAAATALSYERNLVTISIRNGKPTADSGYIELTGELQPVGDIEAIGIKRKLGTNRVYVWGNGKDLEARIAISDPALFTARVFRETLAAQGIDVQGEVRSADWTKPTGAAEGTELTSAE
ncbi:MAG: D-alanyl-D-alanine carboxypeptidase/D-alanyl-D-alanine-endopeptidase, partial [Acidobacteriota bacterium]|nr:D-alanyl-D-alanine carboxypeptidase/D-alanyl-D-alanine-endopeptidase [Acidobacteriota bacterium]